MHIVFHLANCIITTFILLVNKNIDFSENFSIIELRRKAVDYVTYNRYR